MIASTEKTRARLADTLRRVIGAGRVVTSGPGYAAAAALRNGAARHRPGVIARCAEPAHAQASVLAAQECGVPLSVRGGGHDWVGRALVDSGLTIDLTGLRQVRVDPASPWRTVGGGATAADLVGAAQPFGLTAATGSCGAVETPTARPPMASATGGSPPYGSTWTPSKTPPSDRSRSRP